jgi:hypothetical protein
LHIYIYIYIYIDLDSNIKRSFSHMQIADNNIITTRMRIVII